MIAILGATGSIGGALARLLAQDDRPLALFARDTRKLAAMRWPAHVGLHALDTFAAREFDLVINAIGAGDPGRVRALGADILDISDRWDRRVLDTMGQGTRYVFLSSGAIYGACARAPDADAVLGLPVNRLADVPPYTMAKLVAETRHRYLPKRAILDLRVFSFADANLDLSGRFFLAELASSVAHETIFETGAGDFVRDYVGADDLWQMITCWHAAGAPNCALDAYSASPVSKSELLDAVRDTFGTITKIVQRDESPTGAKPVYASAFHAAADQGYEPRMTSRERVLSVLDAVAGKRPVSTLRAAGARR